MAETMPPFRPSPGLRNRHVQSVLASLRLRLRLQRARGTRLEASARPCELNCGDGVRLKGFHSPHTSTSARGLVVLIHGWEGCHQSVYLHSMASALYAHGFDIFRLNLRDHGGTYHLNRGVFHSGLLDETLAGVRDVMRRFGNGLDLYLVGFSLGGNFALRMARYGPARGVTPRHTVAISPMISPRESLSYLDDSALIYRRYFLRKWRASLDAKSRAFPGEYDFSTARGMTRFSEINRHLAENFTPYATYQDYLDTYTLSADLFAGLETQVTIFAAEDDPIVPASNFLPLRDASHRLQVVLTRHGGHCGFVQNWRLESWAEARVLALFTRGEL